MNSLKYEEKMSWRREMLGFIILMRDWQYLSRRFISTHHAIWNSEDTWTPTIIAVKYQAKQGENFAE